MLRRLILSATAVVTLIVYRAPVFSTEDAEQSWPGKLSGYLGCRDGERAPIRRKANTVAQKSSDETAGYEFATPGAAPALSEKTHCYQRVDGIWQADTAVGLDLGVDLTGWGGGEPSMLSLAHGTYTKPKLLLLQSNDDGTALTIYDAHDLSRRQTYQVEDGLAADALSERSRYANYWSTEAQPFGMSIEIGTTHTGRSEIRVSNAVFVRLASAPNQHQCLEPGVANANDPWYTALKPENLRAGRLGYDVARQDPFYLLQNPKAEVFQAPGKTDYCVVDRALVPVGWTLVNEGGAQGYTYRKSLATSAREHQRINASSFGFSVGAQNVDQETGETVVSASYGAQDAEQTIETMRESSTVAQGIGFSRQKLMALVVNEGVAVLSDRFVDLVKRISNRPEERRPLDELIETFGTHYAYAVTFGANAKLTQSFTQQEFLKATQQNESFEHSGGASLFGVGGSANSGELSGTTIGSSGSYGSEGATFVAVGGNGSWNEQGYSAGTAPVPILLDARSLDTLLTPVYFENDPEIYGPVRQRVRDHIAFYLAQYARSIDDTSLVPRVREGVYAIRYADIPGMKNVKGHLAIQVYEVRTDGLSGYVHHYRDGGFRGVGMRLRPVGSGTFGYEGNRRSAGMALELTAKENGVLAKLEKMGLVTLPYCGKIEKLEPYVFPDC